MYKSVTNTKRTNKERNIYIKIKKVREITELKKIKKKENTEVQRKYCEIEEKGE